MRGVRVVGVGGAAIADLACFRASNAVPSAGPSGSLPEPSGYTSPCSAISMPSTDVDELVTDYSRMLATISGSGRFLASRRAAS